MEGGEVTEVMAVEDRPVEKSEERAPEVPVDLGTRTLDAPTFKKFSDLVYAQAGIKLGPHKEALVCARVSKRMRQLGLDDFGAYYTLVEQDSSGTELVELLNAICTNVTHFFREPQHFDFLKETLKKWADGGQTRFRLWSAACSTGEEPYSMAISVRDVLGDACDVRIAATDLSTRAMGLAKVGFYQYRHVENLPQAALQKYFEPAQSGQMSGYQVRPELRRMVAFGRMNLSTTPFPLATGLDVIFCRNVMIYFDNVVRKRLLAEMYRLLRPGGYLMVGHAESLSGMLSDFRGIRPSIYRKV